MSHAVEKFLTVALVVLAVALPAAAQVSAGEAKVNLNGTVSVGYGDDYSNDAGSDHSIAGAGTASLSGYYYNPNFLSFDVDPFYNQSRVDSNYQSLTGASGVSASAKFFSGSPFGGSISYSSTYNSSGNFDLPGLANYTTHGNSDTFTVSWGVHLKDWPTLNINFADAGNGYSVYGAETQGSLHEKTFLASSSYHVAGFSLNGGYQYSSNSTLTPEFLTAGPAEPTNSTTDAFTFGVSHALPFNGAFTASALRLDVHSLYGTGDSADKYDTRVDTLSTGINFSPIPRFTFGANAYYTDNLEGTLYNTLVTAGVVLPGSLTQQSSNDMDLIGTANYQVIPRHLDVQAFVQRQTENYFGSSFISNSYNGTASYTNTLWGGQFNSVVGIGRTSLNTTHQAYLGLNVSTNYLHQVKQWALTGGMAYSQNTQTVLINYTSSSFNYFGSASRKLNRRSYWSVSASGMHSLLNDVPGSANSSQSYTSSLTMFRMSVGGAYSRSSGNALLTSTGLVSTPIPVTALPSSAVVFFNGNSYSLNLGAHPVRSLSLSAVYSKSLSGTNSNSTISNNNTDNMYFLMMYHLRKLDVQAGYSRLLEGFTGSGVPPAIEGSLFIGVSRWFNFF